MKQVCIIMQGIPGSGKSCSARILSIQHDAVILSTDDYHMTAAGVYDYRQELAAERHKKNQERCRHFLIRGVSVIIDNTNITNRQAAPYVQMAVALGVSVGFCPCFGSFRSIHGVPQTIIDKMRVDMETLTVPLALASKPL